MKGRSPVHPRFQDCLNAMLLIYEVIKGTRRREVTGDDLATTTARGSRECFAPTSRHIQVCPLNISGRRLSPNDLVTNETYNSDFDPPMSSGDEDDSVYARLDARELHSSPCLALYLRSVLSMASVRWKKVKSSGVLPSPFRALISAPQSSNSSIISTTSSANIEG